MEKEEQFLKLVSKSLSGEITGDEQSTLDEHMRQSPLLASEYKKIIENWQNAGSFGDDFNPDSSQAWQSVKRRLSDAGEMPGTVRMIKPVYRYLQYAASIILIVSTFLCAYYVFGDRTVRVTTVKGERRQLTLPDQSIIWLNESSELEYDRNMAGKEQRRIILHGEAYFEVAKNPSKPFVVVAGNTVTKVLGTSFNIQAVRGKEIRVSLLEGKVSFSDPGNRWSNILVPGETAFLDVNGSHGKRNFRDVNFLFWKNRQLRFTDEPLHTVLEKLENAYHVKIRLQDSTISRKQITTLVQGDSIQQAIDILQVLLDVRVIKDKEGYLIQSDN